VDGGNGKFYYQQTKQKSNAFQCLTIKKTRCLIHKKLFNSTKMSMGWIISCHLKWVV